LKKQSLRFVVSKQAEGQQKHDGSQNKGIEESEVIEECCHCSILLAKRILQKGKCSKYYSQSSTEMRKGRRFLSGLPVLRNRSTLILLRSKN
jgi:hypothetical protein